MTTSGSLCMRQPVGDTSKLSNPWRKMVAISMRARVMAKPLLTFVKIRTLKRDFWSSKKSAVPEVWIFELFDEILSYFFLYYYYVRKRKYILIIFSGQPRGVRRTRSASTRTQSIRRTSLREKMNTTKRDVKNENLYFMQSVDGQKVWYYCLYLCKIQKKCKITYIIIVVWCGLTMSKKGFLVPWTRTLSSPKNTLLLLLFFNFKNFVASLRKNLNFSFHVKKF